MKNLLKYILSLFIISLLTASILTKVSALDIPTVPETPNKPHPPTVPETPDKPHPPTVPAVPTTPSGEQPTSTTQPGQPTATPQPGIGGPAPTSESKPGDGNGGNGGGGEQVQGQVQGLAAASGDLTYELGLMVVGLIISSFGIKNILAKKLS